MESAIPSRSERDTPPGALQRLLLAVVAAGVLGALGWAAVQVQEAKSEVRGLKEDLVVSQRNERAASAAARAVPVVDLSSKVTDLERRLTEAGKAAAAKEKELNDVITFLRKENTVAQETIQRLSAPPPEPAPEITPPLPDPPAIPSKNPRRRNR
jgi:uncharacterized protein HemX